MGRVWPLGYYAADVEKGNNTWSCVRSWQLSNGPGQYWILEIYWQSQHSNSTTQRGSLVHWQVSVFPDGELHVKAVKQRNKGKWSSRLSTTGTTRTPSVMSYKPPGSPHQHTTHPHTPRTPLKPKAQETIEPEPTTPYRYLYPDKVWDKSLHCHHDFAKDGSSRTRGSDQAVSQQQAPQGHPQCSLAILTHTPRIYLKPGISQETTELELNTPHRYLYADKFWDSPCPVP